MAKWYWLESGRAKGPISFEDLSQKVTSGSLKKEDVLFREGDLEWRVASSFAELKELWKSNDQANPPTEWVVMSQEPTTQGLPSFLQKGPFTSAQLKSALEAGEIKYQDHVWKQGWSEWKKISEVEELKRKSNYQPPPPVPNLEFQIEQAKKKVESVPSDQLVKSVFSPVNENLPPPIPESKVISKNLAWEKTAVDIALVEVTRTDVVPTLNEVVPLENKREFDKSKLELVPSLNFDKALTSLEEKTEPSLRPIRKKKAQASSPPKIIYILLGFSVFFFSTMLIRKFVPQAFSPIEAILFSALKQVGLGSLALNPSKPSDLPQDQVSVAPEASPEAAPSESLPIDSATNSAPSSALPKQRNADPQTKVAEPSSQSSSKQLTRKDPNLIPSRPQRLDPKEVVRMLRIKTFRLAAPEAQLVFDTEAAPGSIVSVVLEGQPGKVVGRGSFYRQLSLRVKQGELPNVLLSNLKMPAGTYYVEARVGEARAQQQFFLGEKNQGYNQELERMRKQKAFQSQSERKTLVRSIRSLEDRLQEFTQKLNGGGGDWAQFYKRWLVQWQNSKPAEVRRASDAFVDQMMFPRIWIELRTQCEEMEAFASSANQAMISKKSFSGSEARQLSASFKSLKTKALNLSLWR